MKGKVCFVLAIGLGMVLLASSTGGTRGSFDDLESSNGNTFQAWVSNIWVQTTQGDFEAGVLNQVDTSSSPGDVRLGTTSLTQTYDFSIGTQGIDCWAWDTVGTDNYPAANMADATDQMSYLGSSGYDQIEVDDSSWYNSRNPGGRDYATLISRFTISEAVADIAEITGYWKGHSDGGSGDTLGLFIYNVNTDSFELLQEAPDSATDIELTGSVTTNIDNYIDSNGYLHILATTSATGENSFETNYVKAVITCTSGYYSSGTIASQVLDTGVAGARWDALCWDETLQTNTDITFEVRASDTLFAKDAATPSWTSVGGASPVTSGLPSGIYMQWRATVTTSDTSETPTLHEVRVYHY